MLKKCSYCGGKGSVRPYIYDDDEGVGKYTPYYAICEECGAHTGLVATAKLASREWNIEAIFM